MLKTRLLTAFLLIPLFLLFLFYLPPPSFFCFTGLITLLCAFEWSSLMGIQSISYRFFYLVAMIFLMILILFIPIKFILLIALIWWVFATLLILLYPIGRTGWGKGCMIRGFFGVLVLIPSFAAINFIRNQPDGTYTLLFLFILIWVADSSAYFVGKKWGTSQLLPHVSPKKSWQGLGGALLFSMVITLIVLWIYSVPIEKWSFILLFSFVTVLFSVVGDLFESMLKRQVDLKDVSQLLPGHGGILDRLDSLMAAAPVFAFSEIIFSHYFR